MGSSAEFSFRTRAESLRALAEQRFDLIVIGGGITGAGVARDAALRGLSVALVERRDFASGTSSRSSKLIHGGLRYLQQGDVGLVREAATERYAVRRIAPHLARPVQMLVPAASRASYAKLSVGLWTYDRLAGVAENERYRMLGKAEVVALEPKLRAEHIYGAGLYYEYLTDDARLVIEVVKSAAALGAVIANYAAVEEFALENDRVSGVVIRDQLTGDSLAVRGSVVINAAGPWVDAVRLLSEPGYAPRLRLTKGIHLCVPTARIGLSHIVVMNARDKRGVFAIPRGDVVYLGTTDTDYPEPEDYPTITQDDVDYLLDAANRTFDVDPPLVTEDIVGAWAGLRPLLHQDGKKPSELSRKDEIMVGSGGLISIAGGKLTTFRRMSERVVDLACERLRPRVDPSRRGKSAEALLGSGATGDDLDAFAAGLRARYAGVDERVIQRLVVLYGSHAEDLVDAIASDAVQGERFAAGLPVTRAEVEYAIRNEMALTLEDFMERRSRLLLWQPDSGLAAVGGVASAMGALLGWDSERVRDEIARYRALVERLKSFAGDPVEVDAAQAAHG